MFCATPKSNRDQFKTTLLRLPSKFQFDYSDAARNELRKSLYYAISDKGTYINYFFPTTKGDPTSHSSSQSSSCDECQLMIPNENKSDDPGHPNRLCGRKFKKGEPIYRCVTCGQDESSGLCSNCYSEEFHKGHDVMTSVCQREFGGVCDCGDPEAWKVDLHCKHHEIDETPETEFPQDFKDNALQILHVVLDYLVDVLAGSTSSITEHKDAASIVQESMRSDLLTEKYFGRDWNSEKFYLLLYNDQNKQYRDAVQRVALATKKVEDFATMVADEVNINGRAKVIGSTKLDELLEARKVLESTGLTCCIKGARDIFREEMCADIVCWLTEITRSSILGNYNLIRTLLLKAICSPWNSGVQCIKGGELPGFLDHDKIPNIPIKVSGISKSENWDYIPNTWNVDQNLADECHYDVNFSFNGHDKDSFHGSRFQYLLYFDIRYWKSFRVDLHNLFNSVLNSSLLYRPLICCQYLDIYPTMLDLFLVHDREPEYSCMTSLNQLLTPVKNATLIAEHGDLTRLLAAAHGFLTSLNVTRPCDVDKSLCLSTSAFKNRKVGQVFFDICCILLKSKNPRSILTEKFIHQICDILELFQGRPTLKREALEHVEYESNDYGVYFNIYSVMASLSEMVAKVLGKIDTSESSHLIALAFQRLTTLLQDDQGDAENCDITPLVSRLIGVSDEKTAITDFKVHENVVSFLHPIHAFISWMIQYSHISNIKTLESFGNLSFDENLIRYVLEHPLRTIVLLSQIKVGFWVRNGFSIKSQLHIYKTSGIRESGFKRDLFMVQLLSSLGNPDFILKTIFSRWSLLPWLKEDNGNNEDYDATVLPLMVEECLLFFIQLFSELDYPDDPNLMGEIKLAVEIIHTLCFKPLTYSKLAAEIPDFLVHEKRFELILKKVAEFIPPTNSSQSGIYKLKSEYYNEVNPYYIHYSSNKREEAEKLIKERIAAKRKIPVKDAYISPTIIDTEDSIFQNIFQVSTSKVFIQFLKSTLKFINISDASNNETMLNYLLHLIHIAVKSNNTAHSRAFSELIWLELNNDHNEPFFYESVGSLLFKILQNEDFAVHHSKVRAIFRALKEKDRTIDSYLKEQVESYDAAVLGTDFMSPPPTASSDFEMKKRMAKERREKIMAKFKQKQSRFVENNSTADESHGCDTEMDNEELVGWRYPEEHCILCQMPKGTDDIFGIVFNAIPSSCFRSIPFDDKYWVLKAFHENHLEHGKIDQYFDDVKDKSVIGPAFPANKTPCTKTNAVASSCGHGMHYSCYKNYLVSTRSRQTQITRTVPEDFEHFEFICPLCKSLGNLFIPILWNCNNNSFQNEIKPDGANWSDGFESLRYASFLDDDAGKDLTDYSVEYVKSILRSHYKDVLFQDEIPQNLKEVSLSINNRIADLSPNHFREYLCKLIGNTVGSTEITLRGTDLGNDYAISNLSNQTLTTLRTLVEFRKTWFAVIAHKQQNDGFSKGYTNKLIYEALGKLSFLGSDKSFEVLDDIEIFDFLVSCVPNKIVSTNSIQRMCFTLHFIQIISVILSQLNDKLFSSEVGLFDLKYPELLDSTKFNILTICRKIRDNHPIFDNLSDEIFEDSRFPNVIYLLLERCITPFLRKVMIWNVSCCANTDGIELNGEDEIGSESERICKILNLPSLKELLNLFNDSNSFEFVKLNGFVSYIQNTDNDLKFTSVEFPSFIGLIDIPNRLDDIFTKLLYKGNEVRSLTNFDPAVCLFCGSIMNLQKSSCGESKGECNRHYEDECIGEFGIFLLPKHSSILLLNKKNGSFHPTPYIDSHGEHDSDARQGQILTLNEEKYKDFIRQMWLKLGTPNYITRKLEGTLDIGGWETL
ncbi:E3 ubiquitin-protein ligase [Wickerhamomyces ciferrii]|uniref:E3 ubiquitin-protein ligase n=1 Tax=Wickerhamomyces ciferrii (strain ATCC 14091 / BCRC 22168 / CBS 111 / JCM 3599 / NBRC 0793 / NRRL Y-1031 F-60-10) TaxID=1206466 RepID=K0KGA0_WICCF|nr:E3 ubiquitin-protein ligase [Wickerhamomyces ciferrii]CCH41212.1 E3 ubiquitin-protein ligase [Wickerhamomyces ciferrii]